MQADALSASDWFLFAGTVMGPIMAVLATRVVDILRDRSDRRNSVFVTLLVTRRAAISPEHVQALNRIEIEFARDRDVVSALRVYMDLLEEPVSKDSAQFELQEKRRQRAFASLVQSIGQRLGRRLDKMDFVEGGYYPQGWAEAEELHRDNQRQLNLILKNHRSILVTIAGINPPPQRGPFPPPPGS